MQYQRSWVASRYSAPERTGSELLRIGERMEVLVINVTSLQAHACKTENRLMCLTSRVIWENDSTVQRIGSLQLAPAFTLGSHHHHQSRSKVRRQPHTSVNPSDHWRVHVLAQAVLSNSHRNFWPNIQLAQDAAASYIHLFTHSV